MCRVCRMCREYVGCVEFYEPHHGFTGDGWPVQPFSVVRVPKAQEALNNVGNS